MGRQKLTVENGDCFECGKGIGRPYETCCNGFQCGCMGMPDDPFCSEACMLIWTKRFRENKSKEPISFDLKEAGNE